MIRAFIIDDEQDAITSLKIMLEKFCTGVKVAGTASSVNEAVLGVKTALADVLFLDVEMNGETGFDLLNQPGFEHLLVVFTTAHEQYAIQALKKGAKDYLLKPVDPDELMEAIEKVRKVLEFKRKQYVPDEDSCIFVNTGVTTERIKKADLIYIKADGRYSELYCIENKRLVVCRNIGEYETEFGSVGFFRAHKSILVNLSHVVRLKKNSSDSIEMTDGSLLPVSRRRKTELMEYMAKRE